MPKLPKGMYRVSITTDEVNVLQRHYADLIDKLSIAITNSHENEVIETALADKRNQLQARMDEIHKFFDGRRNNKPPKRKKNDPASTELPFNETDEK